jgi:hypothetical protein
VHLTDPEIDRYSRQIIVPGIGASGQARLCAARIAIVGAEAGVRVATLYGRALGATVVPLGEAADIIIVAGSAALAAEASAESAKADCPIVWYSADERRIAAGVVQPPDVLDASVFSAAAAAASDVMHAIAAGDAVATAAAVILGWEDCEPEYTAVLA